MFLHPSPFHILKKRWKIIFLAGLVLAGVSLLITLLFPLEYRADAQVLVISKSRYGVDPYTVAKSAEKVGENIAAVIKTNDFFEKTMAQSGYEIDKSRFQDVSERTKRKRWQKSIDSSMVFGTAVLNISAYSRKPEQAVALAGAASSALVNSAWEYVGGDFTMKVVNEPVATRWPTRPNIVLNTVLGFVVGCLLMGMLLLKRGN